MYRSIRTIHLVAGAFALPMLLMYGVSAVQMAHSRWFNLRPAVSEAKWQTSQDYTDGRALAHEVMKAQRIRGEIETIRETSAGFQIRIVVPGTVHEIRYVRPDRSATIRTSVAGFMGMLNRLHHAAGLWPEYMPLKLWGVLVAIVSAATLLLGGTGLWMWWLRRQERMSGIILLTANTAFAIVILTLLRTAGP